jgi:hypothetical protein
VSGAEPCEACGSFVKTAQPGVECECGVTFPSLSEEYNNAMMLQSGALVGIHQSRKAEKRGVQIQELVPWSMYCNVMYIEVTTVDSGPQQERLDVLPELVLHHVLALSWVPCTLGIPTRCRT